MKIEDITPSESKDKDLDSIYKYWTPFPKGYNRLLIVICCIIIVYTVCEYPAKVETFLLTVFIEIVSYLAIVWIIRGFKDSSKKE